MDNLIEIIVAFFIIYSIINSILASKKTQRRKTNIPKYDWKSSPSRSNEQMNPNFETLEDLFGIKIPKTENEFPKTKTEESQSLETFTWDPEKEFKEKIKQREALEYRNIQKNLPNIDYDKTPSYEIAEVRRVDKQDVKIYEEDKIKNPRLLEIRKKLINKSSIRDLFIISEILNKPKALRK